MAPKAAAAVEEEEPVAAEQARTALAHFKRNVVDAARGEEEHALEAWSARNRRARAKLRKRRTVQFETFTFAQRRRADNREVYETLDRRVRQTAARGSRKRRDIDAEAAAMAATQARELLVLSEAAQACEAERGALESFAAGRDGLGADLVSMHALCEDLERRRRKAKTEHAANVDRDRKRLEKTARDALLAARRAALKATKARLSRVTRQQIVEMERMEGEMALHTEEVGRLRGEISSMEEDSAQLRARLKHARRRQGEAARRMTTKRQARRARRHVPALASPENRRHAATDVALRCQLSAARAARDEACAESERLQSLQKELSEQTPEIMALLSAARRRLPPCTPGSSAKTLDRVREAWAELDRAQRDAFVADVFEELFERQQDLVVEDLSPRPDELVLVVPDEEEEATHVSEPTLGSPSYASRDTGRVTYDTYDTKDTGATGAVQRAPEHERADAMTSFCEDETSGLADDDTLIREARLRCSKGGMTPKKPA